MTGTPTRSGSGSGDDSGGGDGGLVSRPPRRLTARGTVAWGLVGSLTFLVLHQGYLLVGGQFLGVLPVAATAVAVGVVVAVTARLLAATVGNGQR